MEEEHDYPTVEWWHHIIWKLKCPLKSILFMWLDLLGKIHVQEHLMKFLGTGPSRCALCKHEEEKICHIFVNCTYIQDIWKCDHSVISIPFIWEGNGIL